MTAAVLWRRGGTALTRPFFVGCIAITWLGLIVNIFDIGLIRDLQFYSNVKHAAYYSASTRLVSFQGQSNLAGFSLCIYLVALVRDDSFIRGSVTAQLGVAASCIAGVFLTGSRTSVLLLVLILLAYMRGVSRVDRGRPTRDQYRLISVSLSLGLGALLVVYFVQVSGFSSIALYSSLTDRFSALLHLVSGRGIGSDKSAISRISILPQYFSAISHSILLGRGPDFAPNQVSDGTLANVSQNAWLDWSLSFGVPYAAYAAWTMANTWRSAHRARRTRPALMAPNTLLLGVAVIGSFSLISLFWIRPMVVALGALVGVLSLLDVPEDKSARSAHTRSAHGGIDSPVLTSPSDMGGAETGQTKHLART
jgi:hypothetical protein